MSKNALGQGLGALISGASRRGAAAPVLAPGATAPPAAPPAAEIPATDRVVRVPLSAITASPMQPRKHFREEQLTELMDSIREHGIIQPLTVRRVNGNLELIAGERRLRASEKLGLKEGPVIEREASDRDGSPVASDVLQHCETASVPSEQRPAIDNSVGQAAAGLWRFASVRFESQSDRVGFMGCFGECSVVAAIPPTPRIAEPASRWRGRPNLHSSICQRARSAVGPAV